MRNKNSIGRSVGPSVRLSVRQFVRPSVCLSVRLSVRQFVKSVSQSVSQSVGDMETPQHGNASKKQNHKTNLMLSSLNLKLKRLCFTDFHSHGRSARPPSLF